ncbi:MAG: twin-arginine translocase TatA/TatE family subunit, partial [Actinomycetota bacterium]|nr:twin-arginine translocase TatA/TatE family subunit [Actinomycetota bacterium]
MPLPGLNAVHIVVILVVALVAVGPSKLPDLARKGAGLLQDYRRFKAHLQSEIDDVLDVGKAHLGLDHDQHEAPIEPGGSAAHPGVAE